MKSFSTLQHLIRNFSIVAHIDHGKSTLADRFIQLCGGLGERDMKAQVLDSMDLERERGITIKAQSVTLHYRAHNGNTYQLNFIDTPGHVDFGYEVSRSLAASEGVLLIVDAAQGVEAQTVATCYTAIDEGLKVLPVLNKIDLPQAEPDLVKREIEDIIGIETQDAVCVSAKLGIGVDTLLEKLITTIPPPNGDCKKPLQALIIDSWFNNHLGVISLVRIKQGILKCGDKIQVMSTKKVYVTDTIGVFTPNRKKLNQLVSGEIGFVIAGIKDIFGAPVGDTLTQTKFSANKALPGFKKIQPRVFAGLFTLASHDYKSLREALARLRLNDAALVYSPESSVALGPGFRCGFLGLLHMEVVQERLKREYNLELITAAPSVVYEILTKKGKIISISNPSSLPETGFIAEIREPIVIATVLVPLDYLGSVISLCVEKRGVQKQLIYLGKQVSLTYELPMSEVVVDFFDRLKSASRGFASLDYSFHHFQAANLVKVDILINGDKVDALANIMHRSQSVSRGRALIEHLKTLIPRQLFDVAIQASIGSKVIARTTIKALSKNVTAKCYGGDVSRKRKLLEKQKAGKKRIKYIGKVFIPQNAFLAVLKAKE